MTVCCKPILKLPLISGVGVIISLLDLQLPMQSVLVTTNVVGSNPTRGQVYSKQHYVVKFVSDLQHFSGFLQALRFPPPMKLIATI